MNNFKLPFGITDRRSIEILVDEINKLLEKQSEFDSFIQLFEYQDMPLIINCECDSSYTGIHSIKCPLYGHRVKRK